MKIKREQIENVVCKLRAMGDDYVTAALASYGPDLKNSLHHISIGYYRMARILKEELLG